MTALDAFPPVGSTAPDFTLRDQNNEQVCLSTAVADGPVLLVFYPAAFTGTCTGELAGLSADQAAYAECGVETFAISVDSSYSLKTFAEREGFAFSMLSDFWPHGAVASAYGAFDDQRGVARRGTFLVGADGLIAFAEVNDVGRPRDPSRWLSVVRALDAR